jgi:hypothetical protein
MKKDRAAVSLGRKCGLKGGVARAAHLTPEQRSSSARKAVRARWAKAGKLVVAADLPTANGTPSHPARDTSDHALRTLLARLRTATDLAEIHLLSEQIEQVIFHKQLDNG